MQSGLHAEADTNHCRATGCWVEKATNQKIYLSHASSKLVKINSIFNVCESLELHSFEF